MKTKLIYFFLALIIPLLSFGQGNEWIDYNKTYFKVKTAQNDIHRISYESLVEAGFELTGLNPDNLQLFHRGEEVAIRTVGTADASFDPGDYIEFWGKRNDGTQDTELFYSPRDQIHTFYNLFSDTTAFFLTRGDVPGKRMEELNVDPSGLSAAEYHMEDDLQVRTDVFSFGQYYPIGNPAGEVKRSLYDRGQMFMSNVIRKTERTLANGTNYRDFLFENITEGIEEVSKPELTFQIIGFNNIALHRASVYIGPDTDNLELLVEDITLSFNNFGTRTFQINWPSISDDGRLVIRVYVDGFDEYPVDIMSLGYLRLRYPRQLNAFGEEKHFYLPSTGNALSVNISNAPQFPQLYDVSDPTHPKIIQTTTTSGSVVAGVPASANDTDLFLKNANQAIEVQPEPVDFKFNDLRDFDYFIVSHPFLRQAVEGSYDDPIQAYVDYRSSAAGGSFNVLYADVTDLYNEFSYGEYTPLAIRRFIEKAYAEGQPEYLFLIGKSRRVDNNRQRIPNQIQSNSRELVPTMGAPGSDVVFTTGLDGRDHYPAIPVGRLSTINAEGVANYLDKVKEREETIKDSPWTKNFLQLSGGLTTDELFRFREFIQGFEEIVEEDYLGAAVTNVSKTNNNAVQNINISEEVNNGSGVITFFGHSSTTYSDIDVGFVTDPANGYENTGKYPIMIVNGCRGGEIFNYNSFGENWMTAKDRGAINFLSHSDVGIPSALREYTEHFYRAFADTLWMTESIGRIQQKVILDQLNGFSPDEIDFALVEQTNLQGDPAIQAFGHDKVDYIVQENDISITSINDAPVSATSPFFNLSVIVNNAGRTTDRPVTLNVRRTLPDGEVIELPEITVPPVRNRDTIFYEVSNQGFDAFGDNTFEVFLDQNNEVEEGSELNNYASASLFLGAAGTFNTAPANFATFDQAAVDLVVQSANLKANDQVFVVEIDTTDTFDSPWRKTNTLSGKGLANWTVDLISDPEIDTLQYYWRSVFQEDQLEDPTPWLVSTFTNISGGTEGWAQTEFDQFRDLTLDAVAKDELFDRWVFAGNETDINVVTYGNNHPNGGEPLAVTIEIDGSSLFNSSANGACAPESLNAIAFDRDSGRPYLVLRTDGIDQEPQDPLNCGITPQIINRIPANNLNDVTIPNDDLLIKRYLDGVSDGDFVLMFSIGELTYDWTGNVQTQIERIGVSRFFLNNMTDGDPLIIFGEKRAAPGTVDPILGVPIGSQTDATRTEISLRTSIFANTDSGGIVSPIIGPVSQWGRISRKINDNPAEDNFTFEVRGRTADGAETSLFFLNDIEELDLSNVDPEQYPFIRIYLGLRDQTAATPAQLENWHVTYQGVPEGVLTLQNEQNESIELQNGEPFNAQFRFNNISDYDFQGELTVRYTLTNNTSGNAIIDELTIPAVAAGDSIDFEVPLQTEGLLGLNDFEIFVNPGDEIEQFYTNNVIRLDDFLNVRRDEVNPAMDVTFDGVYIIDGDIVSPSPMVEVELRDNNPYLFKTDTTGIDIFLSQVCEGCELNRINFSDPNVTFTPATENENFKIQFQPEGLEDGEYLLQVNASDASGNLAGVGPYEVNFEVISESSITNFYPYPNPFSTSTRFVFTLTGNQIPDQIKIQIFTVSGKLVREITQDEIGPIRVGTNITQYAWDGRDEFGDILANGTYIYRVQARSNGEELGRSATGKDQAFNNDFGKLVIIR